MSDHMDIDPIDIEQVIEHMQRSDDPDTVLFFLDMAQRAGLIDGRESLYLRRRVLAVWDRINNEAN